MKIDAAVLKTWTLENAHGMRAKILNYGAIVTELWTADREGKLSDVVLGFKDPAQYLEPHPYFGAFTGRIAGRLTGGQFTLEGKDYKFAINNEPNHLHGGLSALDKKIWELKSSTEEEGKLTSVTLGYLSPDGEEGYPGNVDLTVSYTLTADNALEIKYAATADRATPLCLTNHSYFNLAGEGSGDMLEHRLEIFADQYVPTDGDLTLQGCLKSVEGQSNDFRTPQRLAERVPKLHLQHGDKYQIRTTKDVNTVPVARVEESESGRVMEVFSTERYVQFYSSKYLESSLGLVGKSGTTYAPFAGLCLECQGYPDALNSPELDDILVTEANPYQQTTVYRFSAK